MEEFEDQLDVFVELDDLTNFDFECAFMLQI
jgi:hypothetical protein